MDPFFADALWPIPFSRAPGQGLGSHNHPTVVLASSAGRSACVWSVLFSGRCSPLRREYGAATESSARLRAMRGADAWAPAYYERMVSLQASRRQPTGGRDDERAMSRWRVRAVPGGVSHVLDVCAVLLRASRLAVYLAVQMRGLFAGRLSEGEPERWCPQTLSTSLRSDSACRLPLVLYSACRLGASCSSPFRCCAVAA